jgi:hypothetical protein
MERLFAVYRTNSSTTAAVTLVLANLVPLAGVLFFGWNVWTIVIVYWLENGVVGIVNVFKIRRAAGPYEPGKPTMTLNGRPVDASSTAGLVSFFALHYGLFWVVHGVFVLSLPLFAAMGSNGPDLGPPPSILSIALATLALAISHGLSYKLNYIGRGEYLRVSPASQVFAPYGRLVALHLTIIIGALAIGLTGAPVAAIVVLVLVKTVFDLGLHFAERRKADSRPDPAATG